MICGLVQHTRMCFCVCCCPPMVTPFISDPLGRHTDGSLAGIVFEEGQKLGVARLVTFQGALCNSQALQPICFNTRCDPADDRLMHLQP